MWLVEGHNCPHRRAFAGCNCLMVRRRCRRRSMIRILCRSPVWRRWSCWPQDCRLGDLVAEKVTLKAQGGVNARLKVPALVAGMVAGADSIDDMDVLRHGGMDRLFAGIRAPSTLGTFLRSFTFGHVRQLDSVAAALLTALASSTPLLPGADQVTYLDLDDRCGRRTATPSR